MTPQSSIPAIRILSPLLVLLGVCPAMLAMRYVHVYEFDTDASRLHIEGGFAGFDLEYAVEGRFGLVVDDLPQQPLQFSFARIRARLIGDPPFDGFAIDPLIGMRSWRGTLSNPFTIDFTGVDGQGLPMNVTGFLGNVALGLQGVNLPTCCDYLEYRLDARAHFVSLQGFVAMPRADDSLVGEVLQASEFHPLSFVPEPVMPRMGFAVLLTLALQVNRRKGENDARLRLPFGSLAASGSSVLFRGRRRMIRPIRR